MKMGRIRASHSVSQDLVDNIEFEIGYCILSKLSNIININFWISTAMFELKIGKIQLLLKNS
jgi:hypothetical protein